jgi:hypothetical protein
MREVGRRFRLGAALVHVGAAHFRAIPGMRFTMDAGELARAARALDPATVPIHYEGWSHFTAGRADVEQAFTRAGLSHKLTWLPLGEGRELAV